MRRAENSAVSGISARTCDLCAAGEFFARRRQLGITPTAVSQRMRALEAQIGVTLFRRLGPKLTFTERTRALSRYAVLFVFAVGYPAIKK